MTIGAVAYGQDVFQAFFRLDTVEHFATLPSSPSCSSRARRFRLKTSLDPAHGRPEHRMRLLPGLSQSK